MEYNEGDYEKIGSVKWFGSMSHLVEISLIRVSILLVVPGNCHYVVHVTNPLETVILHDILHKHCLLQQKLIMDENIYFP